MSFPKWQKRIYEMKFDKSFAVQCQKIEVLTKKYSVTYVMVGVSVYTLSTFGSETAILFHYGYLFGQG